MRLSSTTRFSLLENAYFVYRHVAVQDLKKIDDKHEQFAFFLNFGCLTFLRKKTNYSTCWSTNILQLNKKTDVIDIRSFLKVLRCVG